VHPIRIAAQLHPQQGTWPDLRSAVLRAEAAGYDIAYTWDHFYPLYGDRDGPHLECWTTLAAWAEATSRIEIGALVTCNTYRNPDLLADMARTVDHISGGRLILGLGSGWFRRDYEEYGYPFGTPGSRLGALGETLPRIEARLARLNPPPVRRLPVLIAGRGVLRTTRLVAHHADAWHAAFPERPEEVEPAAAALRGWCDEIGRDPAEIEWGVGIEPDDIERFLAHDAATYLQMGFTQFTLGFNGPDWDVDAGRPFLAWRDERNERDALEARVDAGIETAPAIPGPSSNA
jgi:probable F420-dependent oxidoreductase